MLNKHPSINPLVKSGKYGLIKLGVRSVPLEFDIVSFRAISGVFGQLRGEEGNRLKKDLLGQIMQVCSDSLGKAGAIIQNLDAYCGLNLYEEVCSSITECKKAFSRELSAGAEDDPFIKIFGLVPGVLKMKTADPVVQRNLRELMEIYHFISWLMTHAITIINGNRMGVLEDGISLYDLIGGCLRELNAQSFDDSFFINLNAEGERLPAVLTVPQMWF